MATKTLKVNVTITISTIQLSHPSAGPGEIWPKINVQSFFTQHHDPALANRRMTKASAALKLDVKLKSRLKTNWLDVLCTIISNPQKLDATEN